MPRKRAADGAYPAERFDRSKNVTADLVVAAERAVDQSTELFRFTYAAVRGISIEDWVRILDMLGNSPMPMAASIRRKTHCCAGSLG